jgi:hypothetical protein
VYLDEHVIRVYANDRGGTNGGEHGATLTSHARRLVIDPSLSGAV